MPDQTPDRVIDIPGRGAVAFPGTMTDDQINAAAAKLYKESNPDHPPPAKDHSWVSRALDWLPTAGGAAGGIIGGIGGTVGGVGVGGVPGAVGGAALGGATGEALKQLGHRFLGDVSAPTSAGEAAAEMGTQAALQGGSELAGGLAVKGAMHLGGALMQSAVKPGARATARALVRGVATEDLPVVQTLLKEGVTVSPGGIATLHKIIKGTNDEIASIVKNIKAPIDPMAVATRAEEVAAQAAKDVAPDSAVSAIGSVRNQFLSKPENTMAAQVGSKTVPTGVLDASGNMITHEAPVMGRVSAPISAVSAQEQKQAAYKALKDTAYGEMKGPEIEARKALARGLKEEIQKAADKGTEGLGKKLAALNTKEGAAITSMEAVANRLAVKGNADPIALAWLSHNPAAAVGYIASRSPAVKSLIARGLYAPAAKAANLPWLTPNALRLLVQGVVTTVSDGGKP